MTEQRPTRADGLEAHEVEDGLVVYQADTDRVHYLNPVASVILELCTGDHTEVEIEAWVGAAWNLPEPPHEEVQDCLEQFRSEGIVR